MISGSICLFPRRADSTAAVMQIIAPIMNEICIDGINALANAEGNHVVLVNVLKVELGMFEIYSGGKAVIIVLTGLYPNNAANNAPLGGILLSAGAN